MDRRTLLELGVSLATLATSTFAVAQTAPPAAAAAPKPPAAKPPLFADDVQFWFETQRIFGNAEYGGALFPSQVLPCGFSGQRGINGIIYLLLTAHMVSSQHMLVIVWGADLGDIAGAYLLTVYIHGYIGLFGMGVGQGGF